MNLKKLLYIFIIATVFLVGCSNYQVQNKSASLPDEATKRKTMTKIQNNINEITNKDYDYVIDNLGKPDVISYNINKNNIKNIESINDILKLKDINLVYLKKVSEEDVDSSALYLQIKDNAVKKAQIVDCSKGIINKHLDKSQIYLDYHSNGDIVKLNNSEMENLNQFIGIDSSEIEKIVGDKQASYDVSLYDNKVEESINIYHLNNEDKLLCMFIENDKISKIDVIDSENQIVSEIKNIILDN